MESGPIIALLRMKEAEDADLNSEISHDTAMMQEFERKAAEVRTKLTDRNSRLQKLKEEISLLRSALGGEIESESDEIEQHTNEFTIDLVKSGGAASVKVDLKSLDLSDNEPKVRQHTIEVRRRTVAFVARNGPSTTADLVEWLTKDGFKVSEDKQVANLSAILSRTSFFESKSRRWHLDADKLLAVRRM